jgi:competence protein ComGF
MKEKIGKKKWFADIISTKSRGFTFLEMLLSLSIFFLILIYISHTVPLLKYHNYSPVILDRMAFEVFMKQAKREVLTSDRIYYYDFRMILINGGDHIIYERYGEKIRRRVNSKGHEVLLFDIKNFIIEKINNGLKLIIEHNNGQTSEGEIFIPNGIPVISEK